MRRSIAAFLLVVTSGTTYARPQGTENQEADSLAVEIVGDTVNVCDYGAYENCNSVFVTTATRVEDTLSIMQTDVEPVVARCNCLLDLRASFTGLPGGKYTAVVLRDLRVKFPDVTVFLVGAVQFEYHPSGSADFASWGYQSGCLTNVGQPETTEQPRQFVLMPTYPNPFNPSTTICYGLPSRSHVTLTVFNALGQKIVILAEGEQEAGYHDVRFEAGNLASGVYLCRLQAGRTSLSQKMLYVR